MTTATVWVCRTRTSGPCKPVYTASFGGKSVVGQVIEGVGTIVTPVVAAKIIGNAISSQSDNTVVNSNASAEGGNATATGTGGSNTNTNTATGGAGGAATANPTVTGPTTTINNTVSGGTTTPPGSPL
ncbi:hypothetical protein JXR01_03005 [Candidatus Kaiserbacteria bacterium]|nr:MAG: hypothetical protein JXR01_03005 [Candidatus Kaiserbacteria bacterium]